MIHRCVAFRSSAYQCASSPVWQNSAKKLKELLKKELYKIVPDVINGRKNNFAKKEDDMIPGTETLEETLTDVLTGFEKTYHIIVWNDEVNTFEWVIETLIEVCGHSEEQAEQCAMLIHTKGKYAVKNGSYEKLKPQRDAITDRGIGATIEEMA